MENAVRKVKKHNATMYFAYCYALSLTSILSFTASSQRTSSRFARLNLTKPYQLTRSLYSSVVLSPLENFPISPSYSY
jgi:hypothetical protein